MIFDIFQGKEELGRSTWNLLHTMGSNYPVKPTRIMQNHALVFISSLSLLYPCPYCAKDFKDGIIKNPPRFVSTFYSHVMEGPKIL
jgi:FAD-linked sulfhydryl oxidase